MDDIIEFMIEFFGELLGELLSNIKNPQKRKWALTTFYSRIWLGITAFCGYSAIALWKENNSTGTIVMGMITGLIFLVFGFFIVSAHRQNWKKH